MEKWFDDDFVFSGFTTLQYLKSFVKCNPVWLNSSLYIYLYACNCQLKILKYYIFLLFKTKISNIILVTMVSKRSLMHVHLNLMGTGTYLKVNRTKKNFKDIQISMIESLKYTGTLKITKRDTGKIFNVITN